MYCRYIVSDCDSIETMVDDLQWMNDEPENAVAQVMRAGTYVCVFL